MKSTRWLILICMLTMPVIAECTDIYDTVIPTDIEMWEGERMQKVLDKLPPKERELVENFRARHAIKMVVLGLKDQIPPGITIRQVLEKEKDLELGNQRRAAREKEMEAKKTAEWKQLQKQLDGILTVALVSKTSKRLETNVVDLPVIQVTCTLTFKNSGPKAISGVDGEIQFIDLSGKVIFKNRISKTWIRIPVGGTITAEEYFDSFTNGIETLRDADQSKIKPRFIPERIEFEDGMTITRAWKP